MKTYFNAFGQVVERSHCSTPVRSILIVIGVLVALIQVRAQSELFTISHTETTVEKIIDEIRNQSNIDFIYNHEELSKCPPVTIDVTNSTLEEVLSKCLENTQLTFKYVNNTIVIAPKEPKTDDGSQGLSQTIRGSVLDADSKLPLIGATVRIMDSDPPVGTITNVDGEFRLNKMPVGRVDLQLTYVGYKSKIVPNIVVSSGKEVVLELAMHESTLQMNEIVVRPKEERGETLNEMAIVSARSISAEETRRYAGGFSDPSRLLSNFAGVTSSPNGENDIIVRGNSPKYIQWRLEGVEITNPTHFADQNSIKGGISALNNNLLSTSDFQTGAFSPEYGDVLSGVYDVNLRKGNNEKFEAALGVGLLGTDVTLEGPFKKDYAGSYLMNYRYSTVALISDLGLVDVDGLLSYQDATFKVVLPTKNLGTFSVFGLGGLSSHHLDDIEPDGQVVPGSGVVKTNISKDHDKKTFLINTGVNHVMSINKKSYLNSSISYSNSGIQEEVFESNIYRRDEPLEDSVISRDLHFKNNSLMSAFRGNVTYNNKLNAKNKLQVGTKYTLFNYNFAQRELAVDASGMLTLVDFDEYASTLRNFVTWKHRLNDDITIVAGLHNMNVLFNDKHTLEPRIAANWQINNSNAINIGYGSHSNMEKIHHYYAQVQDENGTITEPNRDLDLLKAHHFVLGYEKRITDFMVGKLDFYYQGLYNLPVENNDTSFYATINEWNEFKYVDLVNEGTGKNYGVELTLEKFFNSNYYYQINASLFESKYKSLENIERNTTFNGNYLINVLGGKEFVGLGKKKNQTLGVNTRMFFGGGRKIIPLLRDDNGDLAVDPDNDIYWDYSKAYENQIDDIFQLNVSASYKWDKPRSTHELFIDLINVTNSVGRMYEYYDESEPESIGYITQMGFFPNLMYRVYF